MNETKKHLIDEIDTLQGLFWEMHHNPENAHHVAAVANEGIERCENLNLYTDKHLEDNNE